MKYEPVIGLEIHAELKTRTKMFCFSPNDPNETRPNTHICPVCMGHPGTLPVINESAVKKVILVGHALEGAISTKSHFDRKNYFYPDLPKGYQISQYQFPLVKGGHFTLESGKDIRITRVHLEEDTGRLIHDTITGKTLVDFNRAGVPLMELVTEPDFRTGEEVKEFGEELQKILRYIGASDADMEKGQMRVEVNISLRPEGRHEFGTKVEIKNINSFKYAADAVDYEIKRQSEALDKGEKIVQETRGWNEDKKTTFSQRSKEEAHDYRYFPEPDLPPLSLTESYIADIYGSLPELPKAKRNRFVKEYGIQASIADIISRDKTTAGFFEEVVSELLSQNDTASEKGLLSLAASFFTGEFMRVAKEGNDMKVTAENVAELLTYLADEKISNLAFKEVFAEMIRAGEDPTEVIERLGLWQMSDAGDLESIASHIIEENPRAVADVKEGKGAALQFLVGQMMKESRGKANPKVAMEIFKKLLS